MNWFFLFFVLSGFCSLLYQIVWLRLAMAAFGVTTISISIVLSVFMAGLALGSWGGGRLVTGRVAGVINPLRLYAATEAVIALAGFLVAPLLGIGHDLLIKLTGTSANSNLHYLLSGALIGIILLPFCICMGSTFPVAMAAVRKLSHKNSESSFSYLYLANLCGATLGCLLPAFVLIELLGFYRTLLVASSINLTVAAIAIYLSAKVSNIQKPAANAVIHGFVRPVSYHRWLFAILFLSGFVTLALEVIWTRLFLPFLGPVVYTFAIILAIYLAATATGSYIYRRWFRRSSLLEQQGGLAILAILSAVTALFPLVTTDLRIYNPGGMLASLVRVFIGIGPLSLLLGIMTPGVLDQLSCGDPRKAGSGYAFNTVGCILGPLAAGFFLLPQFGEKTSVILLALPLLAAGLYLLRPGCLSGDETHRIRYVRENTVFALLVAVIIVLFAKGGANSSTSAVVLRDHTATVVASGEGMDKKLLVNGNGMTILTPVTKMMVHLPLAMHQGRPSNGLVLCMGMGTSFRSMLSWGVSTRVVELVPSVPLLFGYYHADAKQLLGSPNAKVTIDDARRFLERSQERFDVIVIDPPPPVEAAASSLLYSREFYGTVKNHLAVAGIFQQWIPFGRGGTDEPVVIAAMVKSVTESFTFVRAYYSFDDLGMHLIASQNPLPEISPEQLALRLPKAAAADLVEWGPHATAEEQFAVVLSENVPLGRIISASADVPAISDNHPLNEYFFLRRVFGFNPR